MPAANPSPRPSYRISLDGQDITPRINGRLLQLTLIDNRGMEADQLDITLSDYDGKLAIPRKGVELRLAIGWEDGLVERGTYIVDEVEHSGAPDVIILRARSADLRGSLRVKRSQSWHCISIGDLVRTIANRQNLTPLLSEQLARISLEHIDQTDESDIAFLTRLAERYDAVATVKAGNLLFLAAGEGTTASGQSIPTVAITRAAGDSHRYSVIDREQYTGVVARWHDLANARLREVIAGSAGNLKSLRQTYPTEAAARAAAQAEWNRIGRGAAAFSLTLARGRPDLYPETPLRVRGFKRDIDERSWLITRVTHTLTEGGYTTAIECETTS